MPYVIKLTTQADTAALKQVTQGLEESAKAAEAAADGMEKVGDKATEAEGAIQRAAKATKDWNQLAKEMGAVAGSPLARAAGDDEDDLDSFLEGMNGGEGDVSAAERNAELKVNRETARQDAMQRAAEAIAAAKEKTEEALAERRQRRMAEEQQASDEAMKSGAMRMAAWGTAVFAAGAVARSAFRGFLDQNPEVEKSISRLAAVAQTELGQKFTTAVEWAFGANAVSKLESFSKMMTGAADVVEAMGTASATVRETTFAEVLQQESDAIDRWKGKMDERTDYLKRELEHAKEMRKLMLQQDLSDLEKADLPESEKTAKRRQLQRDAGWDELQINDAARARDEEKVTAKATQAGEAQAEAEYRLKQAQELVTKLETKRMVEGEITEGKAALFASPSITDALKPGEVAAAKQEVKKQIARDQDRLNKINDEAKGIFNDPNLPDETKDQLRSIDDQVGKGELPFKEAIEKYRQVLEGLRQADKQAKENGKKVADEWQKTVDRNVQDRANEGEQWQERSGMEDDKAAQQAEQQRAQEDIGEARQELEATDKSVTEDAKNLVEGLKALEAKKRGIDDATADAMARLAASIEDGIAPQELQKVQDVLNNMGGEVANGFSAMASAMSSVALRLESSTKDLNAIKSRLEALESSASAQR
ncbi:hypothetical protein [Verrucomicrobium spinosum]|uniref:hypothetical protein n=1 Tax=Verrucomicrobium spinosum TaxID=2736 RepID=UPI0001746947|nr:hypothetical protein [Verrucomicrobium spinosum]